MKTKICVKCGEENYTEGSKCILKIKDGLCQGDLKEATVYECLDCRIIKATDGSRPYCPNPKCGKLMREYGG